MKNSSDNDGTEGAHARTIPQINHFSLESLSIQTERLSQARREIKG
jgi:hypothetical protein